MIILGIDPGYAIIGYGIIDTSKSDMVVDYGAITTPKEDSLPIRLEAIENSLKFLFDKFKPDVVAIEELFYFKNQKTVIQVAQARGVIILACQKYCGNIYELYNGCGAVFYRRVYYDHFLAFYGDDDQL